MPRILCLAVTLAACTRTAQPGIQTHVALHSVQGCPAVEKAVQDAAVTEMRADLENEIRWRFAPGGVVVAAGAPGAVPASTGSAPAAYTTTNVQVQGVDEPDIVKTDGTHIFALSNGSFVPTYHSISASLRAAIRTCVVST